MQDIKKSRCKRVNYTFVAYSFKIDTTFVQKSTTDLKKIT
jgi:phage FluMu protein Com